MNEHTNSLQISVRVSVCNYTVAYSDSLKRQCVLYLIYWGFHMHEFGLLNDFN